MVCSICSKYTKVTIKPAFLRFPSYHRLWCLWYFLFLSLFQLRDFWLLWTILLVILKLRKENKLQISYSWICLICNSLSLKHKKKVFLLPLASLPCMNYKPQDHYKNYIPFILIFISITYGIEICLSCVIRKLHQVTPSMRASSALSLFSIFFIFCFIFHHVLLYVERSYFFIHNSGI